MQATPMNTLTCALLLASAALTGCGKASEAAAEKAAQTAIEKSIEQGMAKDGTKAKVDLTSGGMKISATDDKGQVSTTEIGSAKVGEADIGLPFYPGAKQDAKGTSRMESADSKMVMTKLDSTDSVEKVAAFYRDKLKPQAAGKTFMDNSSPDNATLTLGDDKGDNGVTVHIEKRDSGTEIMLMNASRPGK
jgi:hypothetical protein